jgi:hypothetical protein
MTMSTRPPDGVPKGPTRAQRFPIHIPVRYHAPRSSKWFEGRTENISHSGVLFRAEFPLELETAVEMRFDLPAIFGEAAGEIICKGAIVRIEESPISGLPPALALAIRTYRMSRKQVH